MFPCTGCGACCQNITNIEELKEHDLGNGTCKHLDHISNKCTIYNDRPNICRIDEMFDLVYSKKFTRKEFYIENAKACNKFQELYGLDKNFRVTTGD